MAQGKEGAIFVVNSWIEQDAVLKNLFAPKEVALFPSYADEATQTEVSYPYIRYQYIPLANRGLPYLRRDWCQYFVGAKDFSLVVNAVERLFYLLNLSAYESLDLPVKDPDGKYKIQDIIVNAGTIQNSPGQDQGVWEQGLSFTLRYVILNPGWGVTEKNYYKLEALLS